MKRLNGQSLSLMNRLNFLRVLLIIWLAWLVEKDDDLYGTLMSIRRMQECKKLVKG
jgi:hypothetical protein